MNNEQLIMNAALQHHLYTADEAKQILADYGELPLHSLQGWRKRSPEGFVYRIKKGEHGIEARLWKKRKEDSKQENVENTKRYFYLAKTYLFSESQVELVKVEEKGNGNNKKIPSGTGCGKTSDSCERSRISLCKTVG